MMEKPTWVDWTATALLWAVILFVAFTTPAHAQEVYINNCALRPQCTLGTNISWAQGNQTFIFPAYSPNESIRIWIHNNNTTSAHTSQTVSLFVTDDATATSLLSQSDRWVQGVLEDNVISGAKCSNVAINNPTAAPGANGKATCYANGMYAAQVAVRITGAVAAAGSPDTFDIGIVQQPGNASGSQPGSDEGTGLHVTGWSSTLSAEGGTVTGPVTGTIDLFPGGCYGVSASDPTVQFASGGVKELAVQCDAFGRQIVTGGARDGSTVDISGSNRGTLRPIDVGGVDNATYNSANNVSFRTQSSSTGTTSSTADSVLPGMQIVTPPATWAVTDQGTAKQCSASIAASATGKRHFITGCTVCVAAGATPQTPIFANLRDGATGAGTIIYAETLAAITNTPFCASFKGVLAGTANTAATCELAAASAATVACTANIQGYDQ